LLVCQMPQTPLIPYQSRKFPVLVSNAAAPNYAPPPLLLSPPPSMTQRIRL
jgi:hypothetical protein